MYDGILSVVRHTAKRQPLVVLVDDLQWAPELSLLLHIARRRDTVQVLIVGTSRKAEFSAQPALVQAWGDIRWRPGAVALPLKPLDAAATGQLIAWHLGAGLAAQLQECMYRSSGGSLFFIQEAIQLLEEKGVVQRGSDTCAVAEDAEIPLPDSVRRLLLERVERLDGITRRLLAQAAVLGQEFGHQALQATASVTDQEMVDAIQHALRARLLVDRSDPGEERYAFADDQIREALYEDVSPPERRRWHLRAGEVVRDRTHAAPDLASLAWHFTAAGDVEHGAFYSQAAAAQAARLGAWAQALRHYHTALGFWEQTGGNLAGQADLCLHIGATAQLAGIVISFAAR